MGLLPLVFATGWASGVRVYAVILMLGLLGRLSLVHDVPPQLERTDVLATVAALGALEFCADKIPYLDSAWDAVHTVVRPLLASYVGGLIGHDSAQLLGPDATRMPTALGAAVAGGTALASHLVKGSIRLAVNTSPEPFSNIAVSGAEDVTTVGVVVLALAHPWVSAAICAALLLAGVLLAVALLRLIRRGWAALRNRQNRHGIRSGPAFGIPGERN